MDDRDEHRRLQAVGRPGGGPGRRSIVRTCTAPYPAEAKLFLARSASRWSISTVTTFSAPTTEASNAAFQPVPVPISSTRSPGLRVESVQHAHDHGRRARRGRCFPARTVGQRLAIINLSDDRVVLSYQSGPPLRLSVAVDRHKVATGSATIKVVDHCGDERLPRHGGRSLRPPGADPFHGHFLPCFPGSFGIFGFGLGDAPSLLGSIGGFGSSCLPIVPPAVAAQFSSLPSRTPGRAVRTLMT